MSIDVWLGVGKTVTTGSYTFRKDEIIEFASKYDPQRFHVDEEAARHSIFRKLCASGWHTASVWMRFNVLHGPEVTPLGKLEKKNLRFGPSPGLRNLRWTRPVYVDDTITFRRTVTDTREVPGRPGWYLVKNRCDAINQNGDSVMEFESTVLAAPI